MIDQDTEVRAALSMMSRVTLDDLKWMANEDPVAFYRALAFRPDLAQLTHTLFDSKSAAVARQRVLRAIRDVQEPG